MSSLEKTEKNKDFTWKIVSTNQKSCGDIFYFRRDTQELYFVTL